MFAAELAEDLRYQLLETMTSGWQWELEIMRNSEAFTLDDIARSLATYKKAIQAMRAYELKHFGKAITDEI